MLCEKYMEGRSGNRCGLSHKNRVHTVPSAVGYHEFVEASGERGTEATFEPTPESVDIVERLRERSREAGHPKASLYAEAADEIERLTRKVTRARAFARNLMGPPERPTRNVNDAHYGQSILDALDDFGDDV